MTDAVDSPSTASTPIGVGLDGAALLRVSREVGLREWMHGINATAATAMLVKFVAAANAAADPSVGSVDQRVAFEAWAKAQGMRLMPCPDFPGEYEWAGAQGRWECWQAAVAAQRQPGASVPVSGLVNAIDAMEVATRVPTAKGTKEWENGYAFAVEQFVEELRELIARSAA